MAFRKRQSAAFDDDGGSGEDAPQVKKARVGKDGAKDKAQQTKQMSKAGRQKDKDGNAFWELSASGTRRVGISNFQGRLMVQIREYYENKETGEKLPGKKGIALLVDQFAALVSALPDIEAELKAAGISIPRPDYDKTKTAQKSESKVEGQETSNTDEEPEQTKKNFEATSDEDED